MRRIAGLAMLLLTAAMPVRAQNAGAANCTPVLDLMSGGAEPSLRQVAAGADRVHFVKDAAAQPGCPGAGPACAGRGFVVPGDMVIVTGTTGDYACATFTGPPPKAASSSGWLPSRALAAPPPSQAAADWAGDWRCGSEQGIKIRTEPNGRLGLDGNATYGALDPDRVKRGAVNMGEFSTLVPLAGDRLAFLLDDDGNPLPYDAARAKDQVLCALRLWRLGPYLVVADNLQCGGNDVSFTGVYRRAGNPS